MPYNLCLLRSEAQHILLYCVAPFTPALVVVQLTPASAVIPQPIPGGSFTYEKQIDTFNALDDEVLAMDLTVYTRLYTTADFDATGRFPVTSAGSRYAYQLVSCFNGNIHVEPVTSRTSASYISAYDKTFFTGPAMVLCRHLSDSMLKHHPI